MSNETKLILVDHHLSKYRQNVIGVIDHRPFDSYSNLNENVYKHIELVGSCASLVLRIIDQSNVLKKNKADYISTLNLLYGAIILDTFNLSKQADKARKTDIEMVQLVEQNLCLCDVTNRRQTLLEILIAKRSDVSSLNSLQILSKDSKTVVRKGLTVLIPGYPLLVQDYVKLEDAEINLQKFARMTGANVIVLIGMRMDLAKNDNANMRRDLGIINVNNQDLFQKILKELTSNNTVDLCLEKNNEIEFLGGAFYDQRNVVYTRKQILPLICDIMDKF
ncbi:exopolyphosphatase PRUNE1 isoform X3 [Malaya genurostris]|nr:exopolyphosphatase PRUNE1 isoform X3 [Malaya genurostris]XP_058450637.1 exopolyphosphatase PRUNE1 isoform X3 [Malaya genurostris]